MPCRWLFFASLLGLLRASSPSHAQATAPLYTFFQQHFDSTVVYQSGSNGNTSPNYLILAKHQQQVAFFTYRSPYRNVLGQYLPGQLVQKFSQEEARFRATTPDTNRYLLPQRVAADSLRHGWQRLQPRHFWAMQGDAQAHRFMGNCVVEDGEEMTFYLIDKKAIRSARFYAPAFLEACAGKDVGRQQAIQVSSLLQVLLQRVR
jgi:hypothetical protein